MLRPATPLSILLLAAFVLLLLSVLSTPVVKGIPLARFEGVDFGVFGYCTPDKCSGIRVGYSTDGLFNGESKDGDFNLPSDARNSLSSLLIVHPVAALLTLVCFGLAAAAHLHSPSHSPRYLLGLLILLLPTLLVTLLAFLVDILLFVPHLQWGGWIVLAATILLTSSGVVTCAMRRTLVSRKARKKRIAENAEMSGENFYNRQNATKMETVPAVPAAATTTTVTGASSEPSGFASFENGNRSTDDDTFPLTSRAPLSNTAAAGTVPRLLEEERIEPTPGRNYNNGPRDEYGNPLPSSSAFNQPPSLRRDPSDPRLRNQYSNSSMGSGSQRGPMGYGGRGRGGYPPRGGYGRGGPYGGPPGPGRGPPGFGRGGRGGPPPPGMGGPRRGPPPGYPPQGPPDAYGGAYPPRQPPNQGYGGQGMPEDYGYGQRRPSPGAMETNIPPSQSPVGHAVSPTHTPGPNQDPQIQGNDADVQGMVGLQQNRQGSPAMRDPLQSPTSVYSKESSMYAPPRAGWPGAVGRHGTPPALMSAPGQSRASPAPNQPSNLGPDARSYSRSPQHGRSNSGDNYYEDVDPRFAPSDTTNQTRNAMPSALTPGAGNQI
ncbi:regulator of ime2 [Arachnomyces sp. PD_36]|nr:regulator of ime2 [Arachnomyces sp. PD_36]